MSAGGALGGLFVSLIAPHLFQSFFEWRIALAGGYILAAIVFFDSHWKVMRLHRWLLVVSASVVLAGAQGRGAATAGAAGGEGAGGGPQLLGVLRVVERAADDPQEHDRALFHGSINHGVQFQEGPLRRTPVGYYGGTTRGSGGRCSTTRGGRTRGSG